MNRARSSLRRLLAHLLTIANLVPLAAFACIVLGVAVWLVLQSAGHANASVVRDRLWFAALMITGAPLVWKTLRLALHGHFATDLIAMLAVIGAVILYQPLAGLLIVLMQTGGEALERFAEGRASDAVRELEAAAPRVAHRVTNGLVEDIAADAVRPGDVLLVRPGELVPSDALVLEGNSTVDVSRLTGEPMPLTAIPGTKLASGSGNHESPLTVRATALARESQYARIVELVRSAQASKAPLQRLADRYAVWFTPATLVVCAVAWIWSGDPQRALAVLVVATPCPLILATPIAIIGGINLAAKRQIIVRHGGALEQIGETSVAILDKTGTLTIGRPDVERVVTRPPWTEGELLRIAAAVEHGSGHLLARTLVAAAQRFGVDDYGLPVASGIVETHGSGVVGRVGDREVIVGARSFVLERCPMAVAALDALDASFANAAGLRAYVAVDGEVVGVVAYADRIRTDAADVVRELRALGMHRVMLLSGDRTANAEAVASTVGLTEVRGDLLPNDKAAIVRELLATKERVLMVGDGTNDAPAMSTATVGVSLAAHGGGITAEAADIVVLADELERIPEMIRIGRRTMRIARQSLVVGLGLSGVAMLVAVFGFIRPAVGALLQELIDVAVILNAIRASRAPSPGVRPRRGSAESPAVSTAPNVRSRLAL